ncbi:MAG: hypothetical protein ACD_23C00570G0004 [uncultured bacterium]|nr:MAG: hypothetical protein ACD_23C00570G0004 [uncultured bacterium]
MEYVYSENKYRSEGALINREQIESSDWAKRFQAACPTSYIEAIDLAERVLWVCVEQRDDHSSRGDYLWAVIPEIEPEFWLDALPTKRKAMAVCREMGWQIRQTKLEAISKLA